MKVGSLQDIELKHLKGWVIDNQDTHIYQITIYANPNKFKYETFCTPECAKAIYNYMLLRKRYGENIKRIKMAIGYLQNHFCLYHNLTKMGIN